MGKARKGNTDDTPVPVEPSEVSKEALRESRGLASAARRQEEKTKKKYQEELIQKLFYETDRTLFYVSSLGDRQEETVVFASTAPEAAEKFCLIKGWKQGMSGTVYVTHTMGCVRDGTPDVYTQAYLVDIESGIAFSAIVDPYRVSFSGNLEAIVEIEAMDSVYAVNTAMHEAFAGITFALGECIDYTCENLRTKEKIKSRAKVAAW